MESKSTPSPSPKTKIDQAIDKLFAYLQRRWQLLALVILYIFFRPTFESKFVVLLQSFTPSWGSFIVWCGIIVTALAYTYVLCRRRYVISEGVLSWTAVLLVGWAYYRFIGVEDYVTTPTRIPGNTWYMLRRLPSFLRGLYGICSMVVASASHKIQARGSE